MPSPSRVDRETTPAPPEAPRPESERSRPEPPTLPPPDAILAVGAGGVIGAAARLGFVELFPNQARGVPWTTLAENVVGAFLLGLVLVAILERWTSKPHLRPFLATGVLGSFTTFSNYTVEIVTRGEIGVAVFYALLSVVLGLAAAVCGILIGRRLFRPRDARQPNSTGGSP
ncbi:MAG: CrcB family protein [Phycisphaerales bacterium]|nr:CrcB family protein [Phycisphaerales bacterium]